MDEFLRVFRHQGNMLNALFLDVGDSGFRVLLPHRTLAACHGHDTVVYVQKGLVGVLDIVMEFQVFDRIPDEADIEPGRMKIGSVAATLVRVHAITESRGAHPQQSFAFHGADHHRPVAGQRVDDGHRRTADPYSHQVFWRNFQTDGMAVQILIFHNNGIYCPFQFMMAGNFQCGPVLATRTVTGRPFDIYWERHIDQPFFLLQNAIDTPVFKRLLGGQPFSQNLGYDIRVEVVIFPEQRCPLFILFADDQWTIHIIKQFMFDMVFVKRAFFLDHYDFPLPLREFPEGSHIRRPGDHGLINFHLILRNIQLSQCAEKIIIAFPGGHDAEIGFQVTVFPGIESEFPGNFLNHRKF
ncbi:MAG: hypothetical protein IH923_06160 [Nitrospinae bacterium]|nr:hypothetical protein [Nitrospinota bacterium]